MKTSALFLGIFLTPLAPSDLGAQQLLWRCVDDRPELALVTDRQFASEPRTITWKFTPIGGGAGFKSEDNSTQAIWRPSDDSLALIAGPEIGQFAIQALGASHVTLHTTGRTYGFRIHGVMLGLGALGCVDKTFESASAPDERSTSQDGFRVVAITMRVTERNQMWWRYAWRLTIRNTSRASISLDATIQFYDSGGFVIDDDVEYGLIINAGAEKTFTGYALINLPGARNVQNVGVKVEKS